MLERGPSVTCRVDSLVGTWVGTGLKGSIEYHDTGHAFRAQSWWGKRQVEGMAREVPEMGRRVA